MSEPSKRAREWRHTVGDVLLVAGAGYVGLTLFAPAWFPYGIVVVTLCIALGAWIGEYRVRWWPMAPTRDREHELRIQDKNNAGAKDSDRPAV